MQEILLRVSDTVNSLWHLGRSEKKDAKRDTYNNYKSKKELEEGFGEVAVHGLSGVLQFRLKIQKVGIPGIFLETLYKNIRRGTGICFIEIAIQRVEIAIIGDCV